MTPVIRRLQDTLFDQSLGLDGANPMDWDFSARIKGLGPDFYKKIIPSHMVLNLEYSLLGQQIRANLLSTQPVKEDEVVKQLVAALLLAELLEHVYSHYLIVPREVARLRAQQKAYRQILMGIKKELPRHIESKEAVNIGMSFAQKTQEYTVFTNLYRLLFLRSKRLLDLIAGLDLNASWYQSLVGKLDKYTDPWIPHLGWFFYSPRLLVNLFLLIKHTVPGPWMGNCEEQLGWSARFQGQLLRRWFQLANDSVWVGVGFVNCFVLTGALAPYAIYLTIAFFVYDVVVSAIRVYVEINRLVNLRKQYEAMLTHAENKEEIQQYLDILDNQIKFEAFRLGAHLINTILVVLATSCAAPAFAATVGIPIAGAVCLVLICLVNIALTYIIEHQRPKDMIQIPEGGVSKLGFFAKKAEGTSPRASDKTETPDVVDDPDLAKGYIPC